MLTHFRYECGKEPRFQCPYCGKRDRKSSNTYRHIRTYHQGALPLPAYDESSATDGHGHGHHHHHHHHHHHQRGATAEYRGRRAAIKNEDGSFWNSGKMSYHCPICNAGYTYKKTLKTHMKYDCGKEPRFKCPYCSKRDKCSSNIYKHIRMRHDGMPVIVHRN
ncbi:Zinc finger protein [Apis mellifera caucasica]|nr:Zinc finger protein [Apis mellifera caucasica]KAG9431012.1 Zinc finger protein [Apis mellifera carnica]